MPKYYIDLRDAAGLVSDQEGKHFPNFEAALEEAKASAQDLVRQYMDNKIPLTEACVEIRDASGQTLAAVTVAEVLEHPVHPHFRNECESFPNDERVASFSENGRKGDGDGLSHT